MTFPMELWHASTAVRKAAERQTNPLERRRLLALADVLDGEARVQRQREETRRVVVEFIPSEPLRRIG